MRLEGNVFLGDGECDSGGLERKILTKEVGIKFEEVQIKILCLGRRSVFAPTSKKEISTGYNIFTKR